MLSSESYCEPCQRAGHFCPASNVMEGETPKCIFCEDGEPCPHGQQKPSQAAAALAGNSLAEHVRKVQSANRQVKRNHERVARQVDFVRAGVPMEEAIRRSEKEIPARVAVAVPEPSAEERTMDEQKICSRPGCGKKLTKANHSGYCAKHFYDSKKKTDAAPRAKRRLNKPATTVVRERVVVEAPASAPVVASLLVSDDQLVRMFTAWPLEEKILCVQRHLDGERG